MRWARLVVAAVPLTARLWHNDGDAPQNGALSDLRAPGFVRGLPLEIGGGEGNLGFGRGQSSVARLQEPPVLVLNQDAIPSQAP